ncbi:TPA: DUF550 domain-containing protein [Klebsiella pneumoniae]|nr:DUF550 domain-containing protein [Klebsiella pneumoniae]
MTKSTITREQLIKKAQEQIEFCRHTKITGEGRAHVNQCAALFEIALAAMDSEPVAYIFKHPAGRLFWSLTDESNKGHDDVMPVYASPQPAPERDQVRIAHAEWSQATFGNVGPVGPLKHLSKEALEAAAEPGDLSEWADMQFLLWDAQRRAGITDEQITQAMIDKLAVNKQRSWPEPKDGEPRLHIKEQPAPVAPVVPDFKKLARELVDNLVDCGGLDEGVKEKYLEWAEKTCRAAMLAAAPQPPGSEPATVPGKWIPVSEQMPEKNQNVLISVNFDSDLVEPLICSARYTGSTFRRGDVTVKPGTGIEEATHWMPLPAAPQEVKGE